MATNPIVNPELVEKIKELEDQWTKADRSIRELNFASNWEKLAARAGLERGFYVQVGKVIPNELYAALDCGTDADWKEVGKKAYEAYRLGQFIAVFPSSPDVDI